MGANSSVPAIYDAPAYAILSLDIVLTTAAVAARIFSRKVMKAGMATDDYLTYTAYVSTKLCRMNLKLRAKNKKIANLGLLISGLLCKCPCMPTCKL